MTNAVYYVCQLHPVRLYRRPAFSEIYTAPTSPRPGEGSIRKINVGTLNTYWSPQHAVDTAIHIHPYLDGISTFAYPLLPTHFSGSGKVNGVICVCLLN